MTRWDKYKRVDKEADMVNFWTYAEALAFALESGYNAYRISTTLDRWGLCYTVEVTDA
jgi:hypothetical protein